MSGGQRGHPLAGDLIVLVTVALVGLGGFLWWLWSSLDAGNGIPWTVGGHARSAITLTLLLVGGLWLAWRVGRGGGVDPAERQGPGRTWCVTDGASLVDSPRRGSVVAHLPPGTAVVEVGRHGRYIQVTGPGGRTGWVEQRSLF